jgi:hypothetical protein
MSREFAYKLDESFSFDVDESALIICWTYTITTNATNTPATTTTATSGTLIHFLTTSSFICVSHLKVCIGLHYFSVFVMSAHSSFTISKAFPHHHQSSSHSEVKSASITPQINNTNHTWLMRALIQSPHFSHFAWFTSLIENIFQRHLIGD